MARFITQLRHGTTLEWESSRVIPAKNELVVEYCNDGRRRFKLGDGNNLFTELSYIDDEVANKLESLQNQVSILGTPKYDEGDVVSEAVAEEVANIRVSTYNGIYNSAGEAVRAVEEETANLRSSLQQFMNADAVDGLAYEDNHLWLVADGVQVGNAVEIRGGTGEGGTGYSVRLINRTGSSNFNAASSASTIVRAEFSEVYGAESTGVDGTVEVRYKFADDPETSYQTDKSMIVQQNKIFDVDVTHLLKLDKLVNIKLVVTGGESGKTQELKFTIKLVEARIESDFNCANVFAGNVPFTYKCVGQNLQKTVHFEIDGKHYKSVDVGTSHNMSLNQTIELVGKFTYGSHDLRVYFTTPEGATSNILRKTILYNDGTSFDPIIGVIPRLEKISYGNPLTIDYVVYTPGIVETTKDLTITVYQIVGGDRIEYDVLHQTNINRALNEMSCYKYPAAGDTYIEFISGNTEKTVCVYVEKIEGEFDLQPVKTGLVYEYSPAGKTNNDANKHLYEYEFVTSDNVKTNIQTELTGFNWVSNGYVDSECLTLSGDSRCTIKLPILTTSYTDDAGNIVKLEAANDGTITTSGRTIEFEFEVKNVTDMTATIISCMSDNHAGFKVTPQNCYMLYSNGANVEMDSTGFILNESNISSAYLQENKRIRLTFVIDKKGSVSYTDTNGAKVTSQCLNIYINGEFANSIPYEDDAIFTATDKFIEIGSNSCIINLHNVKIYNRALLTEEVLQNYKCSPLSVLDRMSRFNDNDVLEDNGSGNIDYYKAIKKYPCLLITGPLAPYKDAPGRKEEEKTESGVTLTKPDGQGSYTVEFELLDKDESGLWLSLNNVQGTSSVKYPVKNYKIYLRRGELVDGKITSKKVKYSLKGKDDQGNDLSIGESTLCWKGDYMSSDHANTFNANLADKLFDVDTDAQRENPKVQNTIYGFRCLLFQRDNETSTIKFAGDGALNNDKGNTATFGLECDGDKGNDTLRQKWEYKNSTDDICLFKSDKLFEPVGGSYHVYGNLESTYPDEGDLKEEGLTPNYYPIQTLYTWVCQRANFLDASEAPLETPVTYQGVEYTTEKDFRKAVFKHEFTKHFNLHHALVYYLFMEFTALCDNRAKNLFLRSEDIKSESLKSAVDGSSISIQSAINMSTGEVDADLIDWENSDFAVWLTDLYDLDSCFGVENVGYLEIPYHAEWQYMLKGHYKFNGHESVLWLMFEEAFADEIAEEARRLTSKPVGSGLDYDSLYKYHIVDNASLVCPTIVNDDMEYKYHTPWVDGFLNYAESIENPVFQHMKDYKYLQRGSRTYQKSSFIARRCNMLYSKYRCAKFIQNDNCLSFRPKATVNDASLHIKYSQTLYPAAKFGDGTNAIATCGKVDAGTEATLSCSSIGTDSIGQNDTIYIGGGKLVTDLGDISAFQPMELRLNNGVSLKRITVGSEAEGYSNTATNSIDTSVCTLLEEINVANCKVLTQLNLSNNGLLKKVNAKGCDANITLPDGGVIEELRLGAPAKLAVMNHPQLSVFDCTLDNVTSLRVENTPNIPALEILRQRVDSLTGGIRLVGMNAEVDLEFLQLLLSDRVKGKYMNASGEWLEDTTRYPHITGTLVYNDTIDVSMYNELKAAYPDLTIKYKKMSSRITFKFLDGTEHTQIVHGVDGVAGDAYDPILYPQTDEDKALVTPTYPATAEFEYVWSGWTRQQNNPTAVEEDALLMIDSDRVVYPAFTANTRSYTVRFWNGSTLIKACQTLYGTSAQRPEDPCKEGYTDHKIFAFKAWYPDPGYIVGDLDCYAQYYVTAGAYYIISATDVDHDVDFLNSTGNVAITLYKTNEEKVIQIPEVLEGLEGHNVTEIDGFENKSVEIVQFPNTVTKFRNNAFNKCSNLEELAIGKNIAKLEDGCFSNCTGLKNIMYNATSAEVEDPKDSTPSPFNYSYSSQGANLSIGNTVTKIPRRLFYQTDNLSLMNERVLDTITWEPDSVCTDVEEYSFYKANPRIVTFPESLISIGSNAFVGNDSMIDLRLPEKLRTIKSSAFASWSSLKKVEIPASVNVIDDSVFADCGSLEEISVAEGNSKFYSTQGCLISISGSKLIRATNNATVPTEGISQISPNAFSGLSNIEFIEIPEGISVIPSNMASNCNSLKTVKLPTSIKEINSQAFMNSSNLKTVEIPEGVTDIYSNAFSNTAITEIVIPSSIVSFHSGFTFKECKHLTTVRFSGIDNISEYGEKMFQNCTSLTDIYWPGTESDAVNMNLWNLTSVDTSKVTIHYTSAEV